MAEQKSLRKKLKKLLQNPLTNARKCDIINKSHKASGKQAMVLEN
jgi:hypothetical protein